MSGPPLARGPGARREQRAACTARAGTAKLTDAARQQQQRPRAPRLDHKLAAHAAQQQGRPRGQAVVQPAGHQPRPLHRDAEAAAGLGLGGVAADGPRAVEGLPAAAQPQEVEAGVLAGGVGEARGRPEHKGLDAVGLITRADAQHRRARIPCCAAAGAGAAGQLRVVGAELDGGGGQDGQSGGGVVPQGRDEANCALGPGQAAVVKQDLGGAAQLQHVARQPVDEEQAGGGVDLHVACRRRGREEKTVRWWGRGPAVQASRLCAAGSTRAPGSS